MTSNMMLIRISACKNSIKFELKIGSLECSKANCIMDGTIIRIFLQTGAPNPIIFSRSNLISVQKFAFFFFSRKFLFRMELKVDIVLLVLYLLSLFVLPQNCAVEIDRRAHSYYCLQMHLIQLYSANHLFPHYVIHICHPPHLPSSGD